MIAKNKLKIIGACFLIASLLILTACSDDLFKASESDKKMDSKAGIRLPEATPTKKDVEKQKNKKIKESYQLKEGLEGIRKLEIVKSAEIKKDTIEIDFICKNRQDKDQSLEEIIWDNSLLLVYIVVDTFPEINEITLSTDYYYLDKFANPYSETVYILSAYTSTLKKINRDYFRPEMLNNLTDVYMYENIKDEENKKNKNKQKQDQGEISRN